MRDRSAQRHEQTKKLAKNANTPKVRGSLKENMQYKSCIYIAKVMHKRLRPKRHRFVYKTFTLLLNLDELGHLDANLSFFSLNRFNLLSFYEKDHGLRDGTCLKSWSIQQFDKVGIEVQRVELLCFPRVLGYVFNPLSIYFGYNARGQLSGIIYEVKNTFGEQHCYVLSADTTDIVRQTCKKEFYVSPFISMDAKYHFKLEKPGDKLMVAILETTKEGPLLVATQHGLRRGLNDAGIIRTIVANGLMTAKVVVGIHWEALRLWLKKVPLVPRVRKTAANK